jgi:hypothetical protein
MSGVAATLIGGSTLHSAVHLKKKLENIPRKAREDWKSTRMLIVDEISFASKEDIVKLQKHVCYLKDNRKPYGDIDVIFCGDMRQLEPVNQYATKIYEDQFMEFHGRINCYIELQGQHRFKNDQEWGLLLTRYRDGKLTEEDIDIINSRVITTEAQIPHDISYATYTNVDRASINTGIFERYVEETGSEEDCVAVFSSALKMQKGNKTYKTCDNAWSTYFYENCGEGDCTPAQYHGRFDPVLMLYLTKPVMINKNESVHSGVANGTKARIIKILLKKDCRKRTIKIGGKIITAVTANEVERVVLKHENEDISPKVFTMRPQPHSFAARLPLPECQQSGGVKNTQKVLMTGIQLPIISNNATTGHKLQGATVTQLLVHTATNVRNWTYVVLSRVREMKGLFLKRKLDKKNLNKYNDIPDDLTNMIKALGQRKAAQFTDDQYNSILS